MIIIIWLAAKYSKRLLYVILRRSGTKKNKREISHPSREISRGFIRKGKKSIDLESVVISTSIRPNKYPFNSHVGPRRNI